MTFNRPLYPTAAWCLAYGNIVPKVQSLFHILFKVLFIEALFKKLTEQK